MSELVYVDAPCPRCRAVGPDIEVRSPHLRKCLGCKLVFDTRKAAPAGASSAVSAHSDHVDAPSGIVVRRDGQRGVGYRTHASPSLTLELPWSEHAAVLMQTKIPPGLWSILLVVLGLGTAFVPRRGQTFPELGAVLVLLAAFPTYLWVALNKNRIEIDVSADTIQVRHRPLPWLGATRVAAPEIAQVYCEVAVQTRHKEFEDYVVQVLLRGSSRPRQLLRTSTIDQALFIERVIEDHLGIRDRSVPGEASYKRIAAP